MSKADRCPYMLNQLQGQTRRRRKRPASKKRRIRDRKIVDEAQEFHSRDWIDEVGGVDSWQYDDWYQYDDYWRNQWYADDELTP